MKGLVKMRVQGDRELKVNRQRSRIHYQEKGRYLCNQAVEPDKNRLTKDMAEVNCKNCLKAIGESEPKQKIADDIDVLDDDSLLIMIKNDTVVMSLDAFRVLMKKRSE